MNSKVNTCVVAALDANKDIQGGPKKVSHHQFFKKSQ